MDNYSFSKVRLGFKKLSTAIHRYQRHVGVLDMLFLAAQQAPDEIGTFNFTSSFLLHFHLNLDVIQNELEYWIRFYRWVHNDFCYFLSWNSYVVDSTLMHDRTISLMCRKKYSSFCECPVVVPMTGLLFRHFIVCYSGPTYFRAFKKAFNISGAHSPISVDVQHYLIDQLGVRFYGYCIMVLNNICKKTVTEGFHMAMVAHYHGISREGLNFYGRLGYFCGLRTFDQMKMSSLGRVDETFRYVLLRSLFAWRNMSVSMIWNMCDYSTTSGYTFTLCASQ